MGVSADVMDKRMVIRLVLPSSSLSTACTLVVGVVTVAIAVVAVMVTGGICMIGVDGSGVLARGVPLKRVLGLVRLRPNPLAIPLANPLPPPPPPTTSPPPPIPLLPPPPPIPPPPMLIPPVIPAMPLLLPLAPGPGLVPVPGPVAGREESLGEESGEIEATGSASGS